MRLIQGRARGARGAPRAGSFKPPRQAHGTASPAAEAPKFSLYNSPKNLIFYPSSCPQPPLNPRMKPLRRLPRAQGCVFRNDPIKTRGAECPAPRTSQPGTRPSFGSKPPSSGRRRPSEPSAPPARKRLQEAGWGGEASASAGFLRRVPVAAGATPASASALSILPGYRRSEPQDLQQARELRRERCTLWGQCARSALGERGLRESARKRPRVPSFPRLRLTVCIDGAEGKLHAVKPTNTQCGTL